jgi:hypothetical protein
LIFYRVFWAFRNKGSSKTRGKKLKKPHLGSSQKMWLFYFLFFSPSVVSFYFFNRIFGRFLTLEGSSKTRPEKSREFFRSRQKK